MNHKKDSIDDVIKKFKKQSNFIEKPISQA